MALEHAKVKGVSQIEWVGNQIVDEAASAEAGGLGPKCLLAEERRIIRLTEVVHSVLERALVHHRGRVKNCGPKVKRSRRQCNRLWRLREPKHKKKQVFAERPNGDIPGEIHDLVVAEGPSP